MQALRCEPRPVQDANAGTRAGSISGARQASLKAGAEEKAGRSRVHHHTVRVLLIPAQSFKLLGSGVSERGDFRKGGRTKVRPDLFWEVLEAGVGIEQMPLC